ncbi:MAG: ABC transporter permease [bacterium]
MTRLMFCILYRDCIGILRQRRSLFQLGIWLFILSCVFVFAWVAFQHDRSGFRPPDMGRQIFVPIAFLQLIFLLSLGGAASGAISGERERNTWDLLTITPLGPWRILLGKLFSLLVFVLVMYIAFLPIWALCFLLGGVSPRDLVGTYVILCCSGILVTVVGFFCSSHTYRILSANWITLALLLICSLVLPLARVPFLWLLRGTSFYFSYQDLGWPMETLFSPLSALSFLLLYGRLSTPLDCFGGPGPVLIPPTWLVNYPYVTFLLATAPVCLLLLALTKRRIQRLEPRSARHDQRSEGSKRIPRHFIALLSIVLRTISRIARPDKTRWSRIALGVFFTLLVIKFSWPSDELDSLIMSPIITFTFLCSLVLVCILSLRLFRRRQSRAEGNPVWMKENLVCGTDRLLRLALLVAGIIYGIAVCTFDELPFDAVEVFRASAIPTLVIICILSPALSGGAVAGERDRNTWNLLRVTALPSISILKGKSHLAIERLLWAAFLFFIGIYCLFHILLLLWRIDDILFPPSSPSPDGFNFMFVNLWGEFWEDLPQHLGCLILFAVLLASCVYLYVNAGIYFSARCRSLTSACTWTFGCILLHALGALVLFMLFDAFMLYGILLALCGAAFAYTVVRFPSKAKRPTIAYSQIFGRMLVFVLGGLVLAYLLETLFFPMDRPGVAWQNLSYIPMFFTPFGLLLRDPKSLEFDWVTGSSVWAILILLHSGILLVLAGVFTRAACRRIDRQEA